MFGAPLVSVVLPVRDAERTIARAIATIRCQTLRDWELLVVDDGSSDGTRAIVDAAAREEARIRVLTQGREGLVGALNAGTAAARGEFIARMDADDESHPERLRLQAEFLRNHPDFGVVACRVEFGGDRGSSAGYAQHVDWLNQLETPEAMALNRFVEAPVAHPSVMFRRALLANHGGYRSGEFPEDYELWLRWMERGVVFGKVRETLLTWHDGPQRLSRTDARYAPEAFFRIKAGYLARHLAALGRREVWIWGAGRPTRKRAAHLGAHGIAIGGYVDVDAKKTGRTVGGVPVIAPAELPLPGVVFVLGYVSSRGARELIRAELRARGYIEGSDFLMGA